MGGCHVSTALLNNMVGLTPESYLFFNLFCEERKNLPRDLSLTVEISKVPLVRYLWDVFKFIFYNYVNYTFVSRHLRHTIQMSVGKINFISLKLFSWPVFMIRKKRLTLQPGPSLLVSFVVKQCFCINLPLQAMDYFAVSCFPLDIATHMLAPSFHTEGYFTSTALPVVPFPLSFCHPQCYIIKLYHSYSHLHLVQADGYKPT